MRRRCCGRRRACSFVCIAVAIALVGVAEGKVTSGMIKTSNCQSQVATFEYGSESTATYNLIMELEIPEEYDNVWLVQVAADDGGILDQESLLAEVSSTPCFDLLDAVASAAPDSYAQEFDGYQMPKPSEYLAYGNIPDFPNTFNAMRLTQDVTRDSLYEKTTFDLDSVSGTCAGGTASLANGVCDSANNVDSCGWDGGDCCEVTCYCDWVSSSGRCIEECGASGYNCLGGTTVTTTTTTTTTTTDLDDCECCDAAVADIVFSYETLIVGITASSEVKTTGMNSFSFSTKVPAWSKINLFVVNADVDAGADSNSPYPNVQGALMNISYTVTFLNAEEDSLFAHPSNNDFELLIFTFILVPLYVVPVALASRITRELKKLEKYHWTARLLMYSIYLGFAAEVLWLMDLLLLCLNGEGAVVQNENGASIRVIATAALMIHFLADALMLTVGILLAKGWSIVRRKLTARSRIIYGTLITLYILSCETAVVWNAATVVTVDEEKALYDSDPGYMVAALRLFLFLGFIWAFATTIRKFKTKQKFFRKLFVLFSLWIIFQPLCGFFVVSSGLCYGILSAVLFATQFLFLLMFWPNQKFNAGFPFHIRTTQMVDAAERKAQEDVAQIKDQLDMKGTDQKDDEAVQKRMAEIREATNPLTRSRVILRKMRDDIGTLMMFSTELGRALEEMQTKDDDPESGEELEDLDNAPTETAFGSEHATAMRETRGRRGRSGRRSRTGRSEQSEQGVEMAETVGRSRNTASPKRRMVDDDDSD